MATNSHNQTPITRPKRWVRIVVPAVIIVAWFVVAGFGGPTFGKLASVSTNDQAAFLPASADSTKVAAIQAGFADSKAIPAIVVVTSGSKFAPYQLGSYAILGQSLGKVDGVQAPAPGQTTTVGGPIPSADGYAVEYIVPISDTKNVDVVVKNLRQVVHAEAPAGTKSYVTGPAGLSADLVTAFGGIDGILLAVALGAVFIILLLVYRSIVLPFVVLFTSMFALTGAILLVYGLAYWNVIKLNGQSQGILSILVIGAATDYSLLLSARYREALERTEDKWAAITGAIKNAIEPIAASAATVILALLCLLFSDLNSNRSLGPIAAIGIAFSFLAAITLLPALLYAFGRRVYWPQTPKVVTEHPHDTTGQSVHGLEGITGLWRRVGSLIARHPRATWLVALAVLGACILGLPQLKASGVPQTALILSKSEAVDGQKVLAQHFDAGSGSPVVIITSADKADATLHAITTTQGIASAYVYAGDGNPAALAQQPPKVVDGKVLINATLADQADSNAAEQVVRNLRSSLPATDASVKVGGVTAIAVDTNDTARTDLFKIIPIVLVVILIILMLLLRSIVAPLLLIGSVVVSYAATLGVSALVFNHLFGFPGADPTVPLFGFVFLVALGVDYNIFLMTRVREESLKIGTHAGILRGLGVTGSVITSAGVVLAVTFAALAIIPILFLAQIAFIVAFGVLLDTIIVRSLLVPALAYDMGRIIWWPSKLWRRSQ
ncbi:MMPL family transporter [Candidatus Saccharibacteria bacterium]|nr:MMPL family transporter [Candidatus Saccharibacteria bacterium]